MKPNGSGALLLAAFLAGCAPATDTRNGQSADTVARRPGPSAPAAPDSTIHTMGIGPVRAGMALAEAEAALGAPFELLGPRMEPCHYVTNPALPGVAFMVIEGRIARVDVRRESAIRTAEGAGVGASEDRIQALYSGRIEVQPHKYVDGHYLIVRPVAPADSNYRILFETDGKTVTSFRSGRMPEVRWVEGCS